MTNPENPIFWSRNGVLGSVKCDRLDSIEMLAVLKRGVGGWGGRMLGIKT